jgi:hypothetical protein
MRKRVASARPIVLSPWPGDCAGWIARVERDVSRFAARYEGFYERGTDSASGYREFFYVSAVEPVLTLDVMSGQMS